MPETLTQDLGLRDRVETEMKDLGLNPDKQTGPNGETALDERIELIEAREFVDSKRAEAIMEDVEAIQKAIEEAAAGTGSPGGESYVRKR